MKKLILGATLLCVIGLHADGELDLSFGDSGKVVTDLGGVDNKLNAVALQPDGKIIAVGRSEPVGGWEFAIIRYTSDGSLDTTFGTGGIVVTDVAGDNEAFAIVVQPDGKIVVAGNADVNSAMLVRYNSDGLLDTTFGTDGIVIESNLDVIYALILQPDGKIIAGGQDGNDFGLARYNSDGSLDTTFGTGGIVITDLGLELLRAAVLQLDGKIVGVGRTDFGRFGLARYNSDGSLDTTFGTGGIVITNLGPDCIANAVALQPDGKIVAAGSSNVALSHFGLARYNSDGSLDETFGKDGLVIEPNLTLARAVVLQPDGKIVTAGGLEIARHTSNGSLDSTFGSDGVVATSFFIESGLVLQPDGKIVAVGLDNINGTFDFALARYLIDSVKVSDVAQSIRQKYTLLQQLQQ